MRLGLFLCVWWVQPRSEGTSSPGIDIGEKTPPVSSDWKSGVEGISNFPCSSRFSFCLSLGDVLGGNVDKSVCQAREIYDLKYSGHADRKRTYQRRSYGPRP